MGGRSEAALGQDAGTQGLWKLRTDPPPGDVGHERIGFS